MSPAVKYTLGRLGLFVGSFVVLLPVPLNILVKAMVAFVASAALSFLLLRKWRDEMAEQLGSIAAKRTAEKDRLRSALACVSATNPYPSTTRRRRDTRVSGCHPPQRSG